MRQCKEQAAYHPFESAFTRETKREEEQCLLAPDSSLHQRDYKQHSPTRFQLLICKQVSNFVPAATYSPVPDQPPSPTPKQHKLPPETSPNMSETSLNTAFGDMDMTDDIEQRLSHAHRDAKQYVFDLQETYHQALEQVEDITKAIRQANAALAYKAYLSNQPRQRPVSRIPMSKTVASIPVSRVVAGPQFRSILPLQAARGRLAIKRKSANKNLQAVHAEIIRAIKAESDACSAYREYVRSVLPASVAEPRDENENL